MNELAWMASEKCWEMPDSIVLEFVVSLVAIAPGDSLSMTLTDWLNNALM